MYTFIWYLGQCSSFTTSIFLIYFEIFTKLFGDLMRYSSQSIKQRHSSRSVVLFHDGFRLHILGEIIHRYGLKNNIPVYNFLRELKSDDPVSNNNVQNVSRNIPKCLRPSIPSMYSYTRSCIHPGIHHYSTALH